MKIAATALLLASALAGTAAQINDFTPIITGAQTVKVRSRKGTDRYDWRNTCCCKNLSGRPRVGLVGHSSHCVLDA